ncbi:hypothetical protein [Candidatus Binatus sp.]
MTTNALIVELTGLGKPAIPGVTPTVTPTAAPTPAAVPAKG